MQHTHAQTPIPDLQTKWNAHTLKRPYLVYRQDGAADCNVLQVRYIVMWVHSREHQWCVLQLDIEGGRRHISQHQGSIAFNASKAKGEDILYGTGTSQLQACNIIVDKKQKIIINIVVIL